jgi:hypothetical protein
LNSIGNLMGGFAFMHAVFTRLSKAFGVIPTYCKCSVHCINYFRDTIYRIRCNNLNHLPQWTGRHKLQCWWRELMGDFSRLFSSLPILKSFIFRMSRCTLDLFRFRLANEQDWQIRGAKFSNLSLIGSVRMRPPLQYHNNLRNER